MVIHIVHIVVETFNFVSACSFCFTDYGTELCCNARSLKLVCAHAHLFKISGKNPSSPIPQTMRMLKGYVKAIKLLVL